MKKMICEIARPPDGQFHELFRTAIDLTKRKALQDCSEVTSAISEKPTTCGKWNLVLSELATH
jgi:hypothetical protein